MLASGDYDVGSDIVQITLDIDVHGTPQSSPPRIITTAPYGLDLGNPGAVASDISIAHSGAAGALFAASGTARRIFARSDTNGGFTCLPVNALIRNSVCWSRATTNGVGVGSNLGSGPNAVTLRNVTAVSDSAYGLSFSASAGAGTSVDAKSVIAVVPDANVRAAGETLSGADVAVTLDHSNYDTISVAQSGSATAVGAGTNQTSPPDFVAASSGDFRQTEDSVGTIDRGAVDSLSGTLDLDGNPRTDGPAPDIGAIEFPNSDDDADGVDAAADNCPLSANADQADLDADAIGNVCDPDRDGDGFDNGADGCPDVNGPDGGFPAQPLTTDTVPPETTIGKSPKRKSKNRRVSIAFGSNEPGSAFECSLDRGAFAPCASPFTAKVKRGKHRFEVRATDAAGNLDQTPGLAVWKVKRRRR